MLNCVFSNRVNLGEFPDKPDWEFSKMDCMVLDERTEKIENSENSFFLEKTISYGDFLTIAFLILIFLCLTIAGIREFAKNRKLERL